MTSKSKKTEPAPAPAAESAESPRVVSRVSTAYAKKTDRMRLTVEYEDGGVEVLWLTQRLLRGVAPALGKFLEENKPKTRKEEAKRSYTELMNRVAAKPTAPVEPPPEVAERLVTKVDIVRRSGKCRITFRPDEGPAASLEMHPLNLRKWLGIVHRTSVKAQWTDDLWPKELAGTFK